MELSFQNALFAAGALLVLLGASSLALAAPPASIEPGAVEAFSSGVDSIFLSLFSGVLIGAGIALLGNGLVLCKFGKKSHVLMPFLLSILFLSLSMFAAMGRGQSPLYSVVAFFACLSASCAFFLSALWCALSKSAGKFLSSLRP